MKTNIPFIIWKEWGRPATGSSMIYGSIRDGDSLLVFHDVIDYGATPIKAVEDVRVILRERKQCKIVGILSILDHEHEGITFIKEHTEVPVETIIPWSELRRVTSSGRP